MAVARGNSVLSKYVYCLLLAVADCLIGDSIEAGGPGTGAQGGRWGHYLFQEFFFFFARFLQIFHIGNDVICEQRQFYFFFPIHIICEQR